MHNVSNFVGFFFEYYTHLSIEYISSPTSDSYKVSRVHPCSLLGTTSDSSRGIYSMFSLEWVSSG